MYQQRIDKESKSKNANNKEKYNKGNYVNMSVECTNKEHKSKNTNSKENDNKGNCDNMDEEFTNKEPKSKSANNEAPIRRAEWEDCNLR